MNNTDRIFLDFSARKLELLTGRIESCLDRLCGERIGRAAEHRRHS